MQKKRKSLLDLKPLPPVTGGLELRHKIHLARRPLRLSLRDGSLALSRRRRLQAAFQAIHFLLFCFLLSCINNTADHKRRLRFKHIFQQGEADNLYNISDLLGENPVLDSSAADFASFSSDPDKKASGFPLLSLTGGYPKILLKKGRLSRLLKIRTDKKGQKAIVSSAQENIKIDPGISFVNEYQFLGYKIKSSKNNAWHRHLARLLGKIRKFKGFPDTDYYILPLFAGNHLILYKLGPPDKMPYDELPLAKRVGGLLAVPLIGYPVQYCVPEVIPDINERETGQYRVKCEGVQMKYAEYIRLKEGEKQVFQYQSKPDLFPRDFFNLKEREGKKDQWFYVRTVVKSPDNEYVGHMPFVPSNLVEFHPAAGKLDVLDAGGYDIKSEDKIRALFIPVEWIDYQIKRDSENLHSSFSEEEKKNIHDRNLRYFKIKFEDLVKNEIEYGGEKTLKNVSITDNYFSFDVEITGKHSGAYLVKFAFYKKSVETAAAEYIPKQWFETDSTVFFPAFSEKRKYYTKALDHSEKDHDRFLRTTRFNPKAEEIRWHFSKQTPNDPEHQWVRELGHLAIDLLNAALQEAGGDSDHKFKVVLDSGADQEVGDIRYNILNLIVSKGKSKVGLLGLGPNVANPVTGEVVSATANVWVNNILDIYINIVRKYIRFQLYPPAWKMRPFSKKMTAVLSEHIHKKTPSCGALPLEPLGAPLFLHEKIKSVCPEVSRFIAESWRLKYDPENPDIQDKELIKSCAKKIAFLPILGVTLHELLHGFAQRHVFSASVDSGNFYKSYDEIRGIFGNAVSHKMKELFGDFPFVEGTACHPQPPQYSSVMDYMHFYNPILFVPGKLDIAALRFIYFDKVDLKNGEVLKTPSGADKDPDNPQQSILDAAASKGWSKEELKNYKVLCGGDNPEEGKEDEYKETDDDQPLCKRFDYGADPFEITINNILQTNTYLVNGRNRYDSKFTPFSLQISSFQNQVGDLYEKWKKYRDELLKQAGKSIEHYSFLNAEHVRRYQQIIDDEQKKSPEFKMYYDIRPLLFDYFQRIVFMPVKHCIYKQKHADGRWIYSAFALENMEVNAKSDYFKYPDLSRERLIHCESPVIKNQMAAAGKELITETGFFSERKKYFLRPKSEDPGDESSAFILWSALTGDTSPFLDIVMEPDFGSVYYREMREYMLNGANFNPYIDETTITDRSLPMKDGEIHFPRFLSYRAEERAVYSSSVFEKRWNLLASAKNKLKRQITNKDLLDLTFAVKFMGLMDIGRLSQSISQSVDNSDYPFFTQAYEEHRKSYEESSPDKISLAAFIKDHPAVLYNAADSSAAAVPYLDAEENIPSQIFRRFNAFWNCIENHNKYGAACEDIEEKRSFIKIILSIYYGGKNY